MANTIKIGNIEASAVMIGNSAVSAVYIGSSKIYPSVPVDYSTQYLTFKVIKGGNITIKASKANVAKTIQYSTDNGSTWTSLTTSTTAQELGGTLNVGDKVLVKGTNTTYGTNSYYNTFGGTAKVNVYGNIMSLISGDSFKNNKTLTDSYTFKRLFYGYTNLLSADNLILPATTLASNCYNGMFYDCTSLVNAPELPATTLAGNCYAYMFSGTNVLPDCSNIDFTSNSVVSSGGLISLFAGTKVTDSDLDRLLPKNTNGKYYLPVTTLASYCYREMFYGCTSLTTAPELPATILADSCYQTMFYGCSSLNYIKCLATDISASNCLSNWVSGVAPSGTFVKNVAAKWDVTGVNGIPSGWTVVTE